MNIYILLALGSNVGNKKENISKAIILLSKKIINIKQAPLYISHAVGYTEQDDFINTAISGNTNLKPRQLLDFVKKIEKEIGRIYRFKWGPREIDIDILFYGNEIYTDESLIIPHPRIHERDFVLQPLVEIDPLFIHPVLKKSVKKLLDEMKTKSIIGKA
ncbi:MAG: 2-amino-4-hydroxy-6-hydroxymethyldihydropteridine diphosphokinase [bacterium]|nr:2-amino-4-hydroxy-6-hydroxymethyldihydropteridine diphosphokinase [bacterium]